MLAFHFLGNGLIRSVNLEKPKINRAEALVKVTFCAFCGSDKRLFFSGSRVIPGHEIAGVVEEAEEANLIGKRVLVYIPLFCGSCEGCELGMENCCLKLKGLIGWQANGGYAEYLAVPTRNLLILPDDIPDDVAALLLDTVGTSGHGIRLSLKVLRDLRKALIIGCGALGLGALIFLRSLNVSELWFLEPNEKRKGLAVQLGGFPLENIEGFKGTKFNFDLVVEASGSFEGRELALKTVGPQGVVLLLGENDQPWQIDEKTLLRRKDVFILRTFYFPKKEFEDNLDIIRKNLKDLRLIIDKISHPASFEEDFRGFVKGEYIKPVLRWT